MTDLDRGLKSQHPTAHGARITFDRLPDVGEACREVAAVLDPAKVPAGAIRAGDELALPKRLVGDDLAP